MRPKEGNGNGHAGGGGLKTRVPEALPEQLHVITPTHRPAPPAATPEPVPAPAPAPRRRGRPRRPHHPATLPVTGMLGLVALAFGQLVTGKVLAFPDVASYSLPDRVQAARALHHFHLPLWDPFRLGGVPFLANPQTAVLYPLNWLLVPFPADRAMMVSLVLHVAFAAVGTYLFARRALGTSARAAALAGAAFALSGFVHNQIGHYEQITSMAWLPWALLATDRMVRARTLREAARPGATLAGAVAMSTLAGHTQYVHMVVVAVAVYAIVVSRQWERLKWIGGAAGLGLAIAAVQLLPTMLLTSQSARSGGLAINDASQAALAPHSLVAALAPSYFSSPHLASVEWWAWVPWSIVALAAIGVVARWGGRRVAALAALAGVGLALSLGWPSPVYRVLFVLPTGVDHFRVPARWVLLTSLALPLLAAVGFDALTAGARPRARAARRVGLLLAVAGVALLLGKGAPSASSVAVGLLAFDAVLLVWFATVKQGRSVRADVLVLAAVVVAELLGANHHAYVRTQRAPAGALLKQPVADRAAVIGSHGGRVLSLTLADFQALGRFSPAEVLRLRDHLSPNAGAIDQTRTIDGFDGGLLLGHRWDAAMRGLLGGPRPRYDTPVRESVRGPFDPERFVELDTTRVVVSDYPGDPAGVLPPGSRLIRRAGDSQIWATPSLGPVFLDDHELVAGLRLHRDLDHPERLVVDVPPAAAGKRVVVSEAWYPGWSASGARNFGRYRNFLMAFDAPAHGGRVVLTYHAPGLLPGSLLTLLALAGVIGLVVWGRPVVSRRRRH